VPEIPILEGCKEFAFGSGPVGALVVHGFTGSPQGMRGLGRSLADRGLTVAGPRLPGHGTTWQDCNTRTATEWVDTVETAFDKLAAETEEIFLVGLSFGGSLCLDIAARRADQVAGIVTLAGLVFTKDPRRFLAPVIARVMSSLPGVGNDIADPDAREISYDRFPTKAGYEMLRFIGRTKAALPQVAAPILIMHGRQDHTVEPANAPYIYEHVSSEDKELLWLERSYHVVTLDYDRDTVADRTFDFIKRHSSHGF